MKSILYKAIMLCLAVLTFTACENYLDKSPSGERTEEEMYTRFPEVEGLVHRLYFMLRGADRPLVYLRYNSESTLCDEEESSAAEGNLFNKYNDGDNGPDADFFSKTVAYSNSAITQPWWQQLYTHIHTCNTILNGIEKYKTPDSPSEPGTLSKRIGEIYFIRAYLHYCLVRNYGECCYVNYAIDPNAVPKFTRENVHEVIQKICDDCDEAFSRVPDQNIGSNFGRVDRGACLGLKAMARWIAATPLYNGSTLKNDNRNFASDYQSYKVERWQATRDAAKAVMDFEVNGAPRFSLFQGSPKTDFTDKAGKNENNSMVYRRLWEMYDYESLAAKKTEWIWFVLRDKTQGWFIDMYPPSKSGSAREMPVQEQVDEYEVVAPDGYGYPIYALKENHRALYNGLITNEQLSEAYDDGNPYVNRDPRFYRDVTYHGATFKGSVINTAAGSPDAINSDNATSTGYYLRKFIDGAYTKDGAQNYSSIDCPPLIRLSTIHLIYAEAVTRTTGPTQEIYDLINAIRERAFMAKMPPATSSNRDLMLDYINRERRVELFHEKTRFWSCRLYLEPTSIGEQTKDSQWASIAGSNDERAQQYFEQYGAYPRTQRRICGMRPVADPEGKIVIEGNRYKMQRFWKEDRVFLEKNYLFPLPLVELQTAGIQQNPNW
ncbi:MAG: RagB/SusD family nutrient uptake outer membrane protein [Alistipes sp.]